MNDKEKVPAFIKQLVVLEPNVLAALCEDGSVWAKDLRFSPLEISEWICLHPAAELTPKR